MNTIRVWLRNIWSGASWGLPTIRTEKMRELRCEVEHLREDNVALLGVALREAGSRRAMRDSVVEHMLCEHELRKEIALLTEQLVIALAERDRWKTQGKKRSSRKETA